MGYTRSWLEGRLAPRYRDALLAAGVEDGVELDRDEVQARLADDPELLGAVLAAMEAAEAAEDGAAEPVAAAPVPAPAPAPAKVAAVEGAADKHDAAQPDAVQPDGAKVDAKAEAPPAADELKAARETPVGQWLAKLGADDTAIAAFHRRGFRKPSDIASDADIDQVVAGTNLGLRNRLKSALKKWEPPAVPALPPETAFDLSAPTVKTRDVEFTVPAAVAHADQLVRVATSLTEAEWLTVARNCNLTFGHGMDDDTRRARLPVLAWKAPADNVAFAQCEHHQSRITTTLTYSERARSLVEQGFTKVTANASYLFASASFEGSTARRHREAASARHLYTVGLWRFPRARVLLDRCTTVSDSFVAAVRAALADHDGPYEALQAVFRDYGHVVAQEVELGGQLSCRRHRTESATVDETKEENQVRAALALKFSSASGGAGYAHGSAQQTTTETLDIADSMAFEARGGDTTLANNPADWPASVRDPNHWTVIAIPVAVSTVDLLPAALRQQVLDVWTRHNRGAVPHPALHQRTWTVTLADDKAATRQTVLAGPWWDTAPQALPPLTLPLFNGAPTAQHQDLQARIELLARNPGVLPLLPSHGLPGPWLASEWVLADRHNRAIRWRTVFSGCRDGTPARRPLFFIEHVQSGRLLAWDVVRSGDGETHPTSHEFYPPLLLVEPEAAAAPMRAGLPALWDLQRAGDAADDAGDDGEGLFQIAHFKSGRLLRAVSMAQRNFPGQTAQIYEDRRLVGGGPCLYPDSLPGAVAGSSVSLPSLWRLQALEPTLLTGRADPVVTIAAWPGGPAGARTLLSPSQMPPRFGVDLANPTQQVHWLGEARRVMAAHREAYRAGARHGEPGAGHEADPFAMPTDGLPGVGLAAPADDQRLLHWRLRFAGQWGGPLQTPLYWIEHVFSGLLLGWEEWTAPDGTYQPPVLLVDRAVMAQPLGRGRLALWRIVDADARLGGDGEAKCLVHHATGRRLRVEHVPRRPGDDARLADGGPSLWAPAGAADADPPQATAWLLQEVNDEPR